MAGQPGSRYISKIIEVVQLTRELGTALHGSSASWSSPPVGVSVTPGGELPFPDTLPFKSLCSDQYKNILKNQDVKIMFGLWDDVGTFLMNNTYLSPV